MIIIPQSPHFGKRYFPAVPRFTGFENGRLMLTFSLQTTGCAFGTNFATAVFICHHYYTLPAKRTLATAL
ncbi:hypothetical protein LJB77_02515 [Ruminococcaceae bacterium OttesenSCG-928-N02]|nr:hypothetical protein [Ruminococcaceae bacterium OttesenSCG-928-N02]